MVGRLTACLLAAAIVVVASPCQDAEIREAELDELLVKLEDDRLRPLAMGRLLREASPAQLLGCIEHTRPESRDLLFQIVGAQGSASAHLFGQLIRRIPETDTSRLQALLQAATDLVRHIPDERRNTEVKKFVRVVNDEMDTGNDKARVCLLAEYRARASGHKSAADPRNDTSSRLRHLTENYGPYTQEASAAILASSDVPEGDLTPLLEARLRANSLRVPASSNVKKGREVVEHEVGPRNANVFAEAALTLHSGGHMAALAHMHLLKTGRPDQRFTSARALLALGPDALPALQALLQIAANDEDPEPTVRLEAITALGAIGSKAQAAGATLSMLVEHDDNQVAARARAALRTIRRDK